jgi:predicted Rossmann fold flavoprotein
MATRVKRVEKPRSDFLITLSHGSIQTRSLVIATEGLSIPKLGATNFGYRLAKQFGHTLVQPVAALDGFVFSEPDKKKFQGLAGLAVDVELEVAGAKFRENILMTHGGLSGPAALQGSLYWDPGIPVRIRWWPGHHPEDLKSWLQDKRKTRPKAELKTVLAELLPERLAERVVEVSGAGNPRVGDLKAEQERALSNWIFEFELIPAGTVGFSKAEVTRGGVNTEEVSSQTLESKLCPGLYFAGEVLDVTGWLGGYNFQWAWASGWVAGQSVNAPRLKS